MNQVRVAILRELAKLGDEEGLNARELSDRLGIPEGDVNTFLHAGQLNDEIRALPGGLVRLTPRMINLMGALPPQERILPARSFEKIRADLQTIAPDVPPSLSERFARTLAGFTYGVLTAPEAQARLEGEPGLLPLLSRLVGKQIVAEQAAIRVESGGHVDRFSIDKVAGGNIIEVIIHVHMPGPAAGPAASQPQQETLAAGPGGPPAARNPAGGAMPDLSHLSTLANTRSQSMTQFEGGRAFIVGVAGYDHPKLKISSEITVKEAKAVAALLKKPDVCAYPEAAVTLITDPEKKGLLAALDTFVAKLESDSKAETVVLYFAGHGVMGTDGKYYFTTKETQLTAEEKAVPETAVLSSDFIEKLRKISSKKLLFIINACFSGNVMHSLDATDSPESLSPGEPPPRSVSVEFLATGEGHAMISACRPKQRSYFSSALPLTYFGEALVGGMEGKEIRGTSGYVGLFELYLHVHDKVAGKIKSLGRTQEPMLTLVEGVGAFPVALKGALEALGPFDPSTIQSELPAGHGHVQRIPKTEIDQFRKQIKVHTEDQSKSIVGDVETKGSAGIVFGAGATVGSMSIEKNVGGDLYETHHHGGGRSTQDATDVQKLQAKLKDIRERAKGLRDVVSVGVKEDLDADLQYAQSALERSDKQRLLNKLQHAVSVLDGSRSAAVLEIRSSIDEARRIASGLSF